MRQKNHQADDTIREEMARGDPFSEPRNSVPQMYQKLSRKLLVRFASLGRKGNIRVFSGTKGQHQS